MKALFGTVVAGDDQSVVFGTYCQAGGLDFDSEYKAVEPFFQVVDKELRFFWRNIVDDDDRLVFVAIPPFVDPFVKRGMAISAGLC